MAYISQPRPDLPASAIPRIVTVARKNNARDGLNGVLVYTGADFAQVIEGPDASAVALWLRVAADARHQEISILVNETTDRPWFTDWRMGYIFNDETTRQFGVWRARRRRLDEADHVELRRLLASADSM
ncbi:MAG: BLUF domain-containing protein [Betaproteobacteria bacterium]